MKILKNGLSHSECVTIARKLFVLILLSVFLQTNAQISFRLEPGVLIKSNSENLGLIINVEPHINFSNKSVLGLRFSVAFNAQKIDIDDSSQFFIDNQNDSAVIAFVPTYDYYFKKNKHSPYVGLGIGYYVLSYIDVNRRGASREVFEGSVKNQLGVLLRSGFQSGNTRIGLEYNFIPKSNIEIPTNEDVGTVRYSYLAISIGFTIINKKT